MERLGIVRLRGIELASVGTRVQEDNLDLDGIEELAASIAEHQLLQREFGLSNNADACLRMLCRRRPAGWSGRCDGRVGDGTQRAAVGYRHDYVTGRDLEPTTSQRPAVAVPHPGLSDD
jgi:hypothetical protein